MTPLTRQRRGALSPALEGTRVMSDEHPNRTAGVPQDDRLTAGGVELVEAQRATTEQVIAEYHLGAAS